MGGFDMSFADTLARIPKILEANLNALLDKAEDPEKMIDQLLVDYKRDLADVKKDTVEVMANLDMAKKKLDECDAEIAKKTLAATNALKAGAEDDARKIIASKQSLEATRASLQENYDLCSKNAELMKEGYNKLVANIEDLENRKDAVKAKLALAKAQGKINETAAKAGSTVNLDAFNQYEEKAERELAKAKATAELDKAEESAESLTEKYAAAGNSTSVDAELEALKAQLGI